MVTEAEKIFASLYGQDPNLTNMWNEAANPTKEEQLVLSNSTIDEIILRSWPNSNNSTMSATYTYASDPRKHRLLLLRNQPSTSLFKEAVDQVLTHIRLDLRWTGVRVNKYADKDLRCQALYLSNTWMDKDFVLHSLPCVLGVLWDNSYWDIIWAKHNDKPLRRMQRPPDANPYYEYRMHKLQPL